MSGRGLQATLAVVMALVLAPLALAPLPAAGTGLRCPGPDIALSGASGPEAEAVCQAVEAAGPFFASVGLRLPPGIDIRLVDRLSDGVADADELGRYDGRQRLIQVLRFAAAREMTRQHIPGLGVEMSQSLWRSYVVHELAHAAVHAGCGRSCPDRAGHEYIAAVAQIAALPETVRADILRHHEGMQGFDRQAEISEIYYALSPCRFAVKAWLHYRQPGNGPAFVRGLLGQTSPLASPGR
jgi:hypothetical protein